VPLLLCPRRHWRVIVASVLLVCVLPSHARAAELDLLSNGLGFADCLDPNATVPGGFPVDVVCDTLRLGATDPLPDLDKTDSGLLATTGGRPLPARPPSPDGTLAFPNSDQAMFARRVDPVTGAPVRATGPRECQVRRGPGDRPAGPDGDPNTPGDNEIPSVGNCLLFDDPNGTGAPQSLRASDAVASDHFANQVIFHTVCTLGFEPDLGFCSLDQFNAPGFFGITSNLLAGGEISSFASDGVRFIRTTAAPFDGVLPEPETRTAIFQQVAGRDLSNLLSTQKALWGCGLPFVSPCGDADALMFLTDESLIRLRDVTPTQLAGGLDLQVADGSVVTQELLSVREHTPGALIGSRTRSDGSQYFEAGISSAGLTPEEVIALGEAGRNDFVAENNRRQLMNSLMSELRNAVEAANPGATQEEINELLLDNPEYDPAFDPSPAANPIGGGLSALVPMPTDAWLELPPWLPDPNWLAQGVLVYQIANQDEPDPRCTFQEDHAGLFDPNNPVCGGFFDSDGIFVPRRKPFNDPTDPTNSLNVFRTDPNDSDVIFGESCIQNFGDTPRFLSGARTLAFDAGCTDVEKLSANLGRFWISLNLIGLNRIPDPPESWEEFRNLFDGDPNNDADGDPLAGPDGIFVANLASGLGNLIDPGRFEAGEKEMQVVRIEVNPVTAGIGLVKLDDFTGSLVPLEARETERIAAAMETFLADYDPDSCGQEFCHLVVAWDVQLNAVDAVEVQVSGPKEVVSVLPVALRFNFAEIDDAGNPSGGGTGHFNMAVLNIDDPIAFQELLDPEHFDPTAPPGLEATVEVEIDGQTFRLFPTTRIRERFLGQGNDGVGCQDLDDDGICDFDQDGDGVWDGADDYSLGPITDDRILCGSGLPGDLIQDAIQLEFARPSDHIAFDAAFPQGLPPRSPVYCVDPQKLIGLTGESSPRRDFIWHGAKRPDDPDADGWPNRIDVCPFTSNTGQEDCCTPGSGSTSNPDGIGDACQCGDVTGDGASNSFDATMIKRQALGLSAPLFNVPKNCDVTGDGACNSFDATMITRKALGLSAPLFGNNCSNFTGEPGEF